MEKKAEMSLDHGCQGKNHALEVEQKIFSSPDRSIKIAIFLVPLSAFVPLIVR